MYLQINFLTVNPQLNLQDLPQVSCSIIYVYIIVFLYIILYMWVNFIRSAEQDYSLKQEISLLSW